MMRSADDVDKAPSIECGPGDKRGEPHAVEWVKECRILRRGKPWMSTR